MKRGSPLTFRGLVVLACVAFIIGAVLVVTAAEWLEPLSR